jgi:hypothetical protein
VSVEGSNPLHEGEAIRYTPVEAIRETIGETEATCEPEGFRVQGLGFRV